MEIQGIIKDAILYPFSDWKKILILGIIGLISSIDIIFLFLGMDTYNIFLVLLYVFEALISFFIGGYTIRILKSSLNGVDELPKFNAWVEMFKDGIKVLIVTIVYMIPVILMVLISSKNLNIIFSGPIFIFVIYSEHVIRAFIGGEINIFIAKAGIWFFITILYSFIIIPIYYMALANMANNKSKLSSAFNFKQIFNKIGNIRLKNIIAFYLVILIPFYPILYISDVLRISILSLIIYVIIILLIVPYLSIYLFRLVSLFYISD